MCDVAQQCLDALSIAMRHADKLLAQMNLTVHGIIDRASLLAQVMRCQLQLLSPISILDGHIPERICTQSSQPKLTDYTRNCNIFIIFHAWYRNTSVLYRMAWHVFFFWDLALHSGCDRRNTFELEMIISIYCL